MRPAEDRASVVHAASAMRAPVTDDRAVLIDPRPLEQ
jgi:hypothetical protein